MALSKCKLCCASFRDMSLAKVGNEGGGARPQRLPPVVPLVPGLYLTEVDDSWLSFIHLLAIFNIAPHEMAIYASLLMNDELCIRGV